MKRITIYLKLRVVEAVDSVAGPTTLRRITEVSKQTFHDKDGVSMFLPGARSRRGFRFTKSTVLKDSRTDPEPTGAYTERFHPEVLAEAIETVRGAVRDQRINKLLLIAQRPLIHKLRLGINEDIRSRITYLRAPEASGSRRHRGSDRSD